MQATWQMTKAHAAELGNALLDAATDESQVCQIISVEDKMVSIPVENGQFLIGAGSILVCLNDLSPIAEDEEQFNNVVNLTSNG